MILFFFYFAKFVIALVWSQKKLISVLCTLIVCIDLPDVRCCSLIYRDGLNYFPSVYKYSSACIVLRSQH